MSYKTLITHLKSLLETIDHTARDDDDRRATLKACWKAGQEVFSYTRETGKPIWEIGQDAGAGRGSLEKCVRFYRHFTDGYLTEIEGHPLYWSYYVEVSFINNKKAREFYLRNAAVNGWSSGRLRLRIRDNYYENRQAEQSLTKEKRAGLREKRQRLYTYGAQVLKVVDGDTLTLDIDVGFNTKMRHKVRLRGINCPEITSKKGGQARAFVKEELAGCVAAPAGGEGVAAPEDRPMDEGGVQDIVPEPLLPVVVIRSYKAGKFGRYLADLWYLKGDTDKERILNEGRLLNQALLDKGLAYKVE